jgi:MFS transporter, DHA1 family, inner membrane transport protein
MACRKLTSIDEILLFRLIKRGSTNRMRFNSSLFFDREVDVNRPISILAIALFAAMGPFVFQVMPVYISEASAGLSLTTSQAGRLAAADLFGILVSSLLIRLVVHRANWRWILTVAIGVIFITNLLCILPRAYEMLVALRFGAGLGAGMVLSLVMASIGQTRHPDRNIAIAIAIQIALGSVGLLGLPLLSEAYGLSSVYLLFAVMAILPLPLVFQMPVGACSDPVQQNQTQRKSPISAWLGLVAASIFYLGQGAFWAYIGQIGSSAGFSSSHVSQVLALSAVVGFLAALSASWIGDRLGRIGPICASSLAMCVAILLLADNFDGGLFMLYCMVYFFFWNFIIAFQIGVIVSVDEGGRAAVFIPAFQAAGLATGPLIGSFLVHGGDFSQVIYLILMTIISSFLLFLIVVKRTGAVNAPPTTVDLVTAPTIQCNDQ